MALKKEHCDLLRKYAPWLAPILVDLLHDRPPDGPETLYDVTVDFPPTGILFVCPRGDA